MQDPEIEASGEPSRWHAWTQLRPRAALLQELAEQGEGAYLLGVKANIAARGFVRSAGSAALDLVPEHADAPIVAALRRTGAVVAGMANMHELAFGITSQNPAFGAVTVPGHPDRSAGGSSGGSAAVVAGGAVSVALGTDTGGSVSIPASLCGVAGFRPTTGRWPSAGTIGLSWTRDTPGLFADTLRRIIALDRAVTGEDARTELAGHAAVPGPDPSRRLRLGISAELAAQLQPHTERSWDRAVQALAAVADPVSVDLREFLSRAHSVTADLMGWETPRLLAAAAAEAFGVAPSEGLRRLRAGVQTPDVRAVLGGMAEAPVTANAYASAQFAVAVLRAEYDALLRERELDGLIFPTTPAAAPPIDVGAVITHCGAPAAVFDLYTRNTEHGTVVGAPMVTFPLPVAEEELPVGVTLQGARFGDAAALQAALRCAIAVGSPAGRGAH